MKIMRMFIALLVLGWYGAQAQLKIYCMDVNQGDATLIVAPTGETLLIDAGLKGDADEILEILKRENITAVDHAVLTHFDKDHVRGFELLKEKGIVIKEPIYAHGGNSKSYKKIVGKTQTLKPGMKIDVGAEVTASCLAARRTIVGGIKAERDSRSNYSENQNSIALVVTYKGFDLFIAGDLTTNVEAALVDAEAVPDVEVYHVNHHGSSLTSSDEEFLRELSPEVAIVSAGLAYHHPNKDVVDRLLELETVVYQTNKNTRTDASANPHKNVPNKYIGDLKPAQDKGTILIEVTDGKYTVKLERHGYSSGTDYLIDP